MRKIDGEGGDDEKEAPDAKVRMMYSSRRRGKRMWRTRAKALRKVDEVRFG